LEGINEIFMVDLNLNIENYDFDDDLINRVAAESKPLSRIYSIDHQIVVIGRGGKPAVELYPENIIRDGIPVYRRYGGGCAVVIDPGNIVISVVLPVKGFTKNRYYFNLLSSWLKNGLNDIGFAQIETAGISDLMVEDRKISGSCIYNGLDYLYYSSTILVYPDTTAMEKYLKHPPREPDYRNHRNHTDFVTGLGEYHENIEISSLIKKLEKSLDIRRLELKES